MKAVQVTCPNCGAGLEVGEVELAVRCAYCGTASRVQRRSRFLERALPPPADGPAPIAVQKHNLAVVIVVAAAVVGSLVTGALVVSAGSKAPTRSTVVSPPPVPERPVMEPPPAKPTWLWQAPLVADVDGNGTPDVIGRVRRQRFTERLEDRVSIAALDGATGALRWESESLGTYMDTYASTLALAGDQVIVALPHGELRTFALATGEATWRRQLDERVERLCRGDDERTLRVIGKDRRVRVLRRADGEVIETTAPRAPGAKPPCVELPTDRIEMTTWIHDRERARFPRDLDLFVEGTKEAELDGARVTVLYGRRRTGTAAAMLAVLDRDLRHRWSAVVATEPLAAEERAPGGVVVSETQVCASYDASASSESGVTCFSLADGARRWHRTMSRATLVGRVGSSLAITSVGALITVDIATGDTRWTFP